MKTNSRNVLLLFCFTSATFLMQQCSSGDEPKPKDCSSVEIVIDTEDTNPSSCTSGDGSIVVTASGGAEPYQFSINNGSFSENATFSGLSAGTYSIDVKDANGCTKAIDVTLQSPTTTLNATATSTEAGCKTSTGTITVNATGGNAPYQFKLNEGAFAELNSFTALAAGSYTITVKDAGGCTTTKTQKVLTGIDYENDIKTILNTKCAVSGCHISGGAAPMSLASFSLASPHAAKIKTQVLSNNMPKNGPPLPQDEKDKIACWVDDGAPQN